MIAWLLMVCAGCRPDSDYTLAIEPFTAPNVELAPDDPDVTLVHRVGTESTLLPLGPLADGEFTELPPLEDGRLGLLVTPTGTAGTEYVPGDLVAYGEADLGGALGADGEERTLPILVTEFAGSGDLGSIGRRSAPLLGAAALLPDGSAFMFGGQRDGVTHTSISRIPDVTRGSWDSIEAGEMPSVGAFVGSVLHTATALDDGTVLVVGGRPDYFSIANHLASAFIYDPATQAVEWQDDTAMSTGRARHQAVKLRGGRVLVFGGWQGGGAGSAAGTFQIFDPDARQFVDAGTTSTFPLGTNVAEVGVDGVVVCGGMTFDPENQLLVATDACDRISLGGDVIPFPDLPIRLAMSATAGLPDGRVLVAGGVEGDINVPIENEVLIGSNVGQATDRAFLYEPGPDAWRELEPLRSARAGAVAIPTVDDRFVIVGGAEQAGLVIPEDVDPIFCPEVFDPADGAFAAGGSCSAPGSAAFPLVSVQPGIGAFVVEGHLATSTTEVGGQAYGIIGLAPDL